MSDGLHLRQLISIDQSLYGLLQVRQFARISDQPRQYVAFALIGSQVDIADEPRAAIPIFRRDFAAVKRLKLGSVTDADDRRIGQLVDLHLHDLVLDLLVERGCRFVKHDDVGVVEQEAGKGKALLLSAERMWSHGASSSIFSFK